MRYQVDTNKIRGLMAENGLTQNELSNAIGITRDSLIKKLRKTSDFKATELIALAEIFKTEPSIFFTSSLYENEKGCV